MLRLLLQLVPASHVVVGQILRSDKVNNHDGTSGATLPVVNRPVCRRLRVAGLLCQLSGNGGEPDDEPAIADVGKTQKHSRRHHRDHGQQVGSRHGFHQFGCGDGVRTWNRFLTVIPRINRKMNNPSTPVSAAISRYMQWARRSSPWTVNPNRSAFLMK